MSMPETTMDEHDGFAARKQDVWRPGQVFSVQPKTQPRLVQGAAQLRLRGRVAAMYGPHGASPLLWFEVVSHLIPPSGLAPEQALLA